VLGQEEVFIGDMSGFLREVLGSFEIPAKKPDLADNVLLQKGRTVRVGDLAMNFDWCGLLRVPAGSHQPPEKQSSRENYRGGSPLCHEVEIHISERVPT